MAAVMVDIYRTLEFTGSSDIGRWTGNSNEANLAVHGAIQL
jgi:hypothetical protein